MSKTNETSYQVGFKKPPVDSQFKPGKSGNPKGRPKGKKNFATDLAEELSEIITIIVHGKKKKVTKQRALAMKMVASSITGNIHAALFLQRALPVVEEVRAERAEEEERCLRSSEEVRRAIAETEEILERFANKVRRELPASDERRPIEGISDEES